jgi:hypothetical protein
MVASLPEHLWQTGWTLVAANVRDVNGEASSVVVVGAPSVAEAEAYTRSLGELAVGRLSPVFADASIETVDAATVIRLPDPDRWWSLGQSLTGQGPTLARLGD